MRLANWCALGAMALLVVGVTPSGFAQLELAIPGVQLFNGQRRLFEAAVVGHGLILAVCMPLTVAALGFAVTAEAAKSRVWTVASVCLLGAAIVATLAVAAAVFNESPLASAATNLAVVPSALVLLFAAVVVMGSLKGPGAVPVFVALSAPLFVAAILFMVVLGNSGVDTMLHDTYYELALAHALGFAVLLLTLGVFTAYVGKGAMRPGLWFGALFGVPTCVTGLLAVMFAATLGLSGVPRRYFDYPELFADRQLYMSICSAVLMVFTIAAFASLALVGVRRGDGYTK